MCTPALNPEQVEQVSSLVAEYIERQRARYAPSTSALDATRRAVLQGFFSPQLLDLVRVMVLAGGRVQNPPFYPLLSSWGFRNLPDFSQMAAITFCDVVVSHEPFSAGLLFHELVHVEQYRQLGNPRFARLYVCGFLNGGSYEAIPLEVNAYELEGRFEADPSREFSVADDVAHWIAEKRFGESK